jgi:hypothetical protein
LFNFAQLNEVVFLLQQHLYYFAIANVSMFLIKDKENALKRTNNVNIVV